jgi:drug/metabolite transporter (DMT)-like permease
LLSRRVPVAGVVLGSQLVGVALALIVAVLRREPIPGATDVVLAVAAGTAGALGILALYSGLAVGRMSVVAPITGVLAAAIPVVVGALAVGLPGPVVLVGFVVAGAAVVLVSQATHEEHGPIAGLRYALAAGVGLGLFGAIIAGVTEGLVAGPLAIVRVAEAVVIAVLVVTTGRAWRVARPAWLGVLVVGALDMAGNLFFIASIQAYRLDVAATLSSLYPVTTVVLAALVLRERITGGHALGIGLAGLAIVLIAGGSAA